MPKDKEIFVGLSESERKNIKKTKSLFAREICNYRKCYGLLYKVLRNISNATKKKEKTTKLRDFFIFQLFCRTIGTSKILLDLIMKGYYFDAMIIERSLLENSCLILYLREDETNVMRWMSGDIKLSKIKEQLNLYSNESFMSGYSYLSDFVHTNLGAVRHLAKIKSESAMRTQIEPKPIETSYEGWFLFYPKHGQLGLEIILNDYPEDIDDTLVREIQEFLKKLDKDGDEFFDSHRAAKT
jgi:hypothetical protein